MWSLSPEGFRSDQSQTFRFLKNLSDSPVKDTQ